MKPVHMIEDLEQIRALTDPLRQQIIESLMEDPKAIAEIAQSLDETPNKLYYHVTALEKMGLIEVVETKQKGNLVERYYQSVARRFVTTRTVFRQSDDGLDIKLDWIGNQLRDVIQELESAIDADRLTPELLDRCIYVHEKLHLRESEVHEFIEEISKVFRKFKKISSEENPDNEVSFTLIFNTFASDSTDTE